ncbi:hypothetical protein AA0113_g6251 [Alternaria arborescens]|uniref:Dolichyl-diphosphooligosaccharide--protein glycosyltransferase subunit 4 n=1 Tax=Alternaria arborescens TaxID=156630 RepID=A0A4Q4S0G6_9PLEO|nr:hypothetical protein AA0113_g6251 [Alternaria arborescens]
MITDSQLYSLAIFLGSAAMLLIVLYHFLEVNSDDHKVEEKPKAAAGKIKAEMPIKWKHGVLAYAIWRTNR